jgi:hypothetical protein
MTIKISQLANLTVAQGNTIVPVVSNITGTLTTAQANVDQLGTYILGSIPTDVATLQANAATQSDLIIGINANVTAANLGIKGYVDAVTTNWTANALAQQTTLNTLLANATAQQTTLNTLLANAATQSDLIIGINANVTAANLGIKGYVDNSVTTANIGIKGYIDQGNSIQAGAITSANVGMKGYVDSQSFYSNSKVETYLPTYSGNIGGLIVTNPLLVVGNITAGYALPTVSFANVIFTGGGLANGYAQLNIQNLDSVGTQNSADFIATAPNGTDSSRYIDMGINGNNFSSSAWTISGANDGYVYINSGNLTLGTDTPNKTVSVHVGGTLAANVVTTFANTGVTVTGNVTATNFVGSGAGLTNTGMVLLGNIIPTVNNSVSLGSLTLTSYKSLYIVINNVAITSSKQCFISSNNVQTTGGWGTSSSNVPVSGTLWLDLGTGAVGGSTGEVPYNNTSSLPAGGLTNVSTSTTTLYFRVSSTNNFVAGGSIVIYGVK